MNLQNLIDYCRDFGLPDPLSGISVPAPLNADTVKSAIMVRCGLQTPLYGDPATFTNFTTHWFNTHQWTFEHLINVIQAEYNPIENVFEDRTDTSVYGSSKLHTGGFKDAASGKDTTTHSDHDYVERTFTNYHDKTDRTFDNYHDKTDRTFDQYHDKTERVYDPDNDNPYKETTEMQGAHNTETRVSAFNDSSYQQSSITGETFGTNLDGQAASRKDIKSVSGEYVDDHTETGKITDDRSESGKITDDRTESGSYKDDTVYGHKITLDNGKTLTRTYQDDKESHVGKDEVTMHRHGNIGVTSAVSLIEEELSLLRHFDIYGYIAELFETDNMLMIY